MTLLNKSFWNNDQYRDKDIPTEFATGLEAIQTSYYQPTRQTFAYAAFADSKDFNHYTTLARLLTQYAPETLSNRQARLAFWLNVYNMLVIHGVMTHGSKNVNSISGFFSDCEYQIGAHTLSLDDIEHGVLRGNARKYRGLTVPFSKRDPRIGLVIGAPDPRIHFALYSACLSSPAWRVYHPDTLDAQLDTAVRATLSRDVRIEAGRHILTVPKSLLWYEKDFGNRERILAFVADYVDADTSAYIRQHADRLTLDYLDFDWTLNNT